MQDQSDQAKQTKKPKIIRVIRQSDKADQATQATRTTTSRGPFKQAKRAEPIDPVDLVIPDTLCGGKSTNGAQCTTIVHDPDRYCETHEYMKDYTAEQLEHITYCSTCRKWVDTEGKKTCAPCRARGRGNRALDRIFSGQLRVLLDPVAPACLDIPYILRCSLPYCR